MGVTKMINLKWFYLDFGGQSWFLNVFDGFDKHPGPSLQKIHPHWTPHTHPFAPCTALRSSTFGFRGVSKCPKVSLANLHIYH